MKVPVPIIAFAVVLVVLTATASERGPQGVSPGAPGRLAHIDSACPTFTWESTPGADRYELVVYLVEPDALSSGSVEFTSENEVLYTSISGRATGWTPESDDCFLAGASYVWFVRAVVDVSSDEDSEWSEPRFFEVAAAPSAEELERAIEVIRRWEAASVDGSPVLSAAADPVSAAVTDSESGAGASQPRSVITGTAAIRGQQTDFSGETYGIVGINASPDGAGIGAANITGGPDLVLDGAVPTELTEAGVDRPSASPQTFSFSNTGGGGMMLDVDGAGILTTASDLDAATLDGMDSTDFVTDAETAALFAVHAASADHDGRYFTETELSTSGTGGSVHWNNLTTVPAGFADGVDDNTTYSFGPGLTVDNGQIVIDPATFSLRIATLDSVGDVGGYLSLAIGADGLGLISYWDDTNDDLKVAHCNNTLCTNATTATVDSTGAVGPNSSIAIGNDDLGLISYTDTGNWDLKVAHCDNTDCSSASATTLDSVGSVAAYGTALAIGADDLGLISYFSGNLKVAHCDNTDCTSAAITTLDTAGDVGRYSSITIGNDGLGLISYFDGTSDDLKVAHCDNVTCTSATISTVDSTDNVGRYTSVSIGDDGLGLISYYDVTNGFLKVAHCDNVNCSTATLCVLDNPGDPIVWVDTSIAIGDDGLGLISYYANHDLKTAHCNNIICNSATINTVDSGGGITTIGQKNAISIGDDGRALVSYNHAGNSDLMVAHLPYGY